MLKTNREPNLTMVNKWLACLYDEEIKDVEDDIQNEAIWAIASTTDWEHDMHLQNVADKQAYLEKLKELRNETNGSTEWRTNGMGKKYYPIEDAINNITKRLNLSLQDSKNMNEEELLEAENIISDYVDFVEHPDYIQAVPKVKETGELILE